MERGLQRIKIQGEYFTKEYYHVNPGESRQLKCSFYMTLAQGV